MSESPGIEANIQEFEDAWRNAPPASIENYWQPGDPPSLLRELICIDLEYRWRASSSSSRRRVADYLRVFPALGTRGELPLALLAEEYRVRSQWGDRPSHRQFLSEYPAGGELQAMLGAIDREIDIEHSPTAPERPPRAAVALADDRAPLRFSDFELQGMVGAGSAGKVYRAWQRSLDRPVAVKFLRNEHLNSASIDRFLQEARTVAKLSHPGIVGIHGVGRIDAGHVFIVMDYIEGRSLADALREDGVPTVHTAVDWIRQPCEAIHHAHGRDVIHCDLKPGNLLLDADRRVRVTDFGMARSIAATNFSRIEGTAPFMAPEQVDTNFGPIDERTDVYGLSAVLYTLLTGQAPHFGDSIPDVLAEVISPRPIVPPVDLCDVPPEVSEICVRGLSRCKEDRPLTALALRDELLQNR